MEEQNILKVSGGSPYFMNPRGKKIMKKVFFPRFFVAIFLRF